MCVGGGGTAGCRDVCVGYVLFVCVCVCVCVCCLCVCLLCVWSVASIEVTEQQGGGRARINKKVCKVHVFCVCGPGGGCWL